MRQLIIGLATSVVFALATVAAHASWTFGTPVNLGPNVNSTSSDSTPNIANDGLSLYFHSDRPGGSGGWDVWMSSRASTSVPWGAAVNMGEPFNTSMNDASPSISADGLSIYYNRGSSGDVWVATRPSATDPWSPANSLTTINSAFLEADPDISNDGLSLFFGSYRPGSGGRDIYVSTRSSVSDAWGTPTNLGAAINGPALDEGASISDDGLALFFMSDRGNPEHIFDLYVSERDSLLSPWKPATKLDISLPGNVSDSAPDIAFGGGTLYFQSTRPGGIGGLDIWSVSVVPEPSTFLLFLEFGAISICVIRWRRRR